MGLSRDLHTWAEVLVRRTCRTFASLSRRYAKCRMGRPVAYRLLHAVNGYAFLAQALHQPLFSTTLPAKSGHRPVDAVPP